MPGDGGTAGMGWARLAVNAALWRRSPLVTKFTIAHHMGRHSRHEIAECSPARAGLTHVMACQIWAMVRMRGLPIRSRRTRPNPELIPPPAPGRCGAGGAAAG